MTYEITEDDAIAFTEGDCWALAREISKRTGWRSVAFGAYPDRVIDDPNRQLKDFDWVHVVVQTPEGEYLDVRGISGEYDLIDMYAYHVMGFYGWEADECDFEVLRTEDDWQAIGIHNKRQRIFPSASVSKVAATVIRQYRAGTTPRLSERNLVLA